MVLPCFNKIKILYPNDDLVLLTNKPISAKAPSVASIMPPGFFSGEIYYSIGTRNIFSLLKILYKIRKTKASLLINLTATRNLKSAKRDVAFFRLAGILKIIGSPSKNDHNLLQDSNTGMIEWEANRLTRRIAELGEIDLTDNIYWNLNLSKNEEQLAEDLLLQQKHFIVISTGTKLQANDWGTENWAHLILKLSSKLKNFGLVILGAESDKKTGDMLLQYWPNNCLNLCGKTSPRISAAVLKKASQFIGHDSGPLHLAGAVNVPYIGIYSARNLPGRWFPRGNNNAIIYHLVECAGCGLETCIVMKKKCIASISVEEVYNAVIKKLSQEQFE